MPCRPPSRPRRPPRRALTGEVKDGRIIFRYASDYEGQALTITSTATRVSAKQRQGTVDVQPMRVGGTLTAAPAPAAPAPAAAKP